MSFKDFKVVFQQHVDALFEHQERLFVVDVDRDFLWELYLDSFPPGTNEIYRERRSHDCSCCRAFIKQFGAVVAIAENYNIVTIWDFDAHSDVYQPVVDAMAAYIKSRSIANLFVTKESGYGTDKSREQMEDHIHTWHHFRVDLPKRFVTRSHKTVDSLMAEARDSKSVFKRSLDEIRPDAIETVLDLIAEKSLYRGEEWQVQLNRFLELQAGYLTTDDAKKDNWCWAVSASEGPVLARIRNHSIGVLLKDLTDGMDVEQAVGRYESIVAPQNYKRPKPIFTKQMVKDAEETVVRLGLVESLPRRHAHLEDITIQDVLWANRDAERQMDGLGIFGELAEEITEDPRRYERLQGIGVEQFINVTLLEARDIRVLLENRHEPNMVSLIAPQNLDAPSLFKWDNNFGWAYNGNVTDSMKQRVKALGGDVSGVLRFSIQWNDDRQNQNDFDAHCIEPSGNHIYYMNKGRVHTSSGVLDVDITQPNRHVPDGPAVENITWSNLSRMGIGQYHFYVKNYAHNGGRTGFKAEIEFNGQIHSYEYPHELRNKEEVTVAKIVLKRDATIEFTESLPSTTSSRDIWGLTTNRFQPVSVITYSPNHWGGRGVGNRHYFFMLAGCVNPENPNGFFNEYLRGEFMEHKRVFAALGSKMRVQPDAQQLSGVGFSSTVRNSMVLKVDGQAMKVVI